MDGQVTMDDLSPKVDIKTEKEEIPVKYCHQNIVQEDTDGTPEDKAVCHSKLLEQCQQELNTVKDKLTKTERQLEKANAYNEDLRGELDKLSSELHCLKRARENRTDAETQTDDISTKKDGLSEDQAILIEDSLCEDNEDCKIIEDTKILESAKAETKKDGNENKDDAEKMEEDAKAEGEAKPGEEKLNTSLADELRATAEAAVQQTGYVYDENSGLYYDYNSGYYYNAEKALYYDPNTGTYFYYNSETGKYDFHSQVDLSQYSAGQDSQQYRNYYSQWQHQDHYHSDKGGNYDRPRKDYHAHSSLRHNDMEYDKYHRPLPRRDRDTSRTGKSYTDYDRHISSERRDKEGSSRKDSAKKKQTKRLQTEEMEYHKRKKKKKDKDKKKKKKKSSRDKRRDKKSERKSEKKGAADGKRKGRESREDSEEGEVRSNDSKERDNENKENDEDNNENNNSDEDMENYNLEGKPYMDELYESLDENSNNERTSEEASEDLYDDLVDDKSDGKLVSADEVSSKSTENLPKVEGLQNSSNSHSNKEHSPMYRDNCNTTHNENRDSSQNHSSGISSSGSKNKKYSKKTNSSTKNSSHNNSTKRREKKSSSKDYSSDSDTESSRNLQHHEKEISNTDTRHNKKLPVSKNSQDKTIKSGNSRKHKGSRSGYCKQSSNMQNKCQVKLGEILNEKQDIDIHETSGKSRRKTLSKLDRQSSRCESVRKTSRKEVISSDSDSDSESSNSLCTGESELESGEITSSSEEEEEEEHVPMQCDDEEAYGQEMYEEIHTNDVIMAEEELILSKWPPCIRVIVTDSDTIDPGSLFIITCIGATVGREKEMDHTILIPDMNVSKSHAEIQFDEKEYQYYLTDLASQNGTFLNEERVSESKVKSKPKVLSHGDTLQFGCTRLLLHIHNGTDTCDECEPGQVQAQLQAANQPQKEIVILSKEEKLRQQRQELKKIKKKYGLKNSAYVDNMGAINNPAYSDKAEERRKTVGSDNPYQPDEAPASVHRPISEANKGHKMLKKMGWTEGESLGKDNEGIKQPISVKFRANKSAGLGSGGAGEGSLEEVGDLNRRQKWVAIQQRYNNMDKEGTETGKGHGKQTLTTPQWVQGETQESQD